MSYGSVSPLRVELNKRIWRISFSVSGFTEEAETMITAMVSPMALNTSSA
jgi:hypothetical protein